MSFKMPSNFSNEEVMEALNDLVYVFKMPSNFPNEEVTEELNDLVYVV